MKKIIFVLLVSCIGLNSCDVAQQVLNQAGGSYGLSSTEVASGLKEALTIGTENGTSALSQVNGFFGNAVIKVWMPPEAQKVESTLRSIGLGSLVDNAILSMNRAAEDAAKTAAPIFINAIQQMTIADAFGILKGGDFAATDYFKEKTTLALIQAFSPVINNSLAKVDATKYWKDVFSTYNKFATNPVNTDLGAYITQKAVDGIFYEIGLEEQKIRQDPAARVTDLLKKVFGSTKSTQPMKPNGKGKGKKMN